MNDGTGFNRLAAQVVSRGSDLSFRVCVCGWSDFLFVDGKSYNGDKTLHGGDR